LLAQGGCASSWEPPRLDCGCGRARGLRPWALAPWQCRAACLWHGWYTTLPVTARPPLRPEPCPSRDPHRHLLPSRAQAPTRSTSTACRASWLTWSGTRWAMPPTLTSPPTA
jgi:hypothetical protein